MNARDELVAFLVEHTSPQELEDYLKVEHLMVLAKAKARLSLAHG